LTSNAAIGVTGDNWMSWTADAPTVGSAYACILLGGTESMGTYAGVGFVDDGTTPNRDMVDCEVNADMNSVAGASINDAGTWTQWTSSPFAATIDPGDYLAIVATASGAFRCYWCDTSATGCDAANEWWELGTGTYTPANISTRTATAGTAGSGLFTAIYTYPGGWSVNAFGGGNGTTLPAPTSCAPNL